MIVDAARILRKSKHVERRRQRELSHLLSPIGRHMIDGESKVSILDKEGKRVLIQMIFMAQHIYSNRRCSDTSPRFATVSIFSTRRSSWLWE